MTLQYELDNAAPSKLSVSAITKRFRTRGREVHALDRVSLDIAEGEFICLLGPSGCGKSTLLNIIAGLDMADEGDVFTDGKRIAGPGRDRMVMFQESALFPWLDVLDNVLFGLKLKPGLTKPIAAKSPISTSRLSGLKNFSMPTSTNFPVA